MGAVFFCLVGGGGRGDAGRWARRTGDPSPAADDTDREVRESLGVATNPGWVRLGLGGRSIRLHNLPGT